jgi:hypothetical protein
MGSYCSKLFYDEPFPTNAGVLQIVRLQERTTAGYGPSKIPHVSKRPTYPDRDAMGRIVIEDGMNRLRAGWPPLHVAVCSTPFKADFMFSTLLYQTDKLNIYMKKHKMLAFCIIGSHNVMILRDIEYDKICKKYPKYSGQTPTTAVAKLAAGSNAGPNCLNEAQFKEVNMRLCNAYREFGVGALVMKEGKFYYHVIVPNEKEYFNHKAMYDESERALKMADDVRHAGSKRTRSGKKFDSGYNN